MNKTTQLIVRTALLLALCVAFQSIRIFIGNTIISVIIIGSLVNLCLYLSVKTVGIFGAAFISIVAPIVSLFQGHLPFFQMVFVVAIGNLILSVVFWLFTIKDSLKLDIIGIIVASIVKFVALFASVNYIIIPMLINIKEIQGKVNIIKTGLLINFSWPQIVTALIGGLLLLSIMPALKMSKIIK
jgi:hypothetical protein